ncbi:MAG TPA: hypothetical protein VGG13_00335 [Candidatus Saccharimonadales bacterium]|jgi:hypothetical protein
MAILIHVIIALSSIAYTTFLFLVPSEAKLKISYGLIGATFLSGTYLVVSRQAHLLSTCETGLVYLGAMTVGVLGVRHRLATIKAKR